MPLFTEGAQSDPDLATSAPPPPQAAEPVPAAPTPAPSASETIDAALRQPGTFTGNFLNAHAAAQSMPENKPTPGYNPLDTLKGTPHEGDQLSIYAGSQNEAYTKYLMAEQDQHAANQKVLDSAGWPGTIAGVAAGFIDPTMAIPILGEERLGATAATAAYGAAFGAYGAASKPGGSTWKEYGENIGTGAILGGVLGKAGSHLSGPEMERATAEVEAARPRINTDGTMAPVEVQPPAVQAAMQPAGAAPVDTRQLDMKSAFGVQKWGASPNLRIYGSDSLEAKRAMNDIANTGLQFKPGDQVAPFGPPLENVALDIKNRYQAQAHDILDDAWKQHYYGSNQPGTLKFAAAKEGVGAPTTADKLSYRDFLQKTGAAMHNGDEHAVPEVQQAAKDLRSKIFDPVAQMAKDTKDVNGNPLLSEDLSAPKGAKSFFPLMPDRDAIVKDYAGTRDLFTDYLGREQEAKAGLQARISGGDLSAVNEWKGKSALKEGEAPEEAAQRMLKVETGLSRQELRSRAEEWTNRLIGSPDGRLDYDVQSAGTDFHPGLSDLRGSLRERKMPIEVNELINRGLIKTDAMQGVASIVRSIVPDVLMTRRFGDVAMTDVRRRIEEEYAAKILPGSDGTKIIKERDGVLADLEAARDRFRGVQGWDLSPWSRKAAAAIRDFQNYNLTRQLGTSSTVRLTDLSNGIFRYGLKTVFRDSWMPMIKSFMSSQFRGIVREQAKDAGLGVDGMLGHIRHNLYDISDSAPQNRLSRAMAWGADKSMILNFHTPLTDLAKSLSSLVTQGEIGRRTARVADGTASAKEIEFLAQNSISREMAVRISKQYEAHGTEVDGRKIANLSDWTDQGAREAFGAALQHESSMTVMQAGIGDKPIFMDNKFAGMLTQYRNFMAAATEKILIANLQQRDFRSLQGVLTTMGMGALATFLYHELSGQPQPKTFPEWIKESLDRSAMTGWFGELNRSVSGATRGQWSFDRLYGAYTPPSRRADVDLAGQFMGPTADFAERTLTTAAHAVTSHSTKKGDVSNFGGSDVHNLRVMLPLQNLMGLRIQLDKVEAGIDRTFGFKVPKTVSHEEPEESAPRAEKTGPPRSHHAQKPVAAPMPQPASAPVAPPQEPQPPAPAPVAPPPQPPPAPPKPRRKHRAVN